MNKINSSFFKKYFKPNLNLLLKISGISFFAASQAFIASSASAGTALTTKETFSGKVNYTVTGGTLRSNPDAIDACSLNSTSTAQLSGIPSNATVKKAYLYWGASGSNVDSQVTLDGTSLTADDTYQDDFSLLNANFFQGVKDVTNIVSNKGNGNYSFSGLDAYNAGDQCRYKTVLSAWSLIVIYEDPSIARNELNTIKLYEGFTVSRNQSVNYTLDGIQVADNPAAKFSMLLWEGDSGLGGSNEFFKFNNNLLTDTLNPATYQFNSTINSLNLENTYGIDLDTFDVSSYVTEGQTSVTGTISTNNDLVLQGAALVMVTDELANESPSAQPDTITTDEDTTGTYNLITGDANGNGRDSDPEGDTLTVTKFNVGGTEYTFDSQTTSRQVAMPSEALLTVNSNGDISYNPNGKFESLNPGQTGLNPDTFTYTVSDSEGSTSTATATVNINGVADDPVAVDDTRTTDEDSQKWIPVLRNDSDPNTAKRDLTITKVNNIPVSVGSVITLDSGATLTVTQVRQGNLNRNGQNNLKYNPQGSASLNLLNNGENFPETFTYTVSDPEGNTDEGSVTVTVNGITDTFAD